MTALARVQLVQAPMLQHAEYQTSIALRLQTLNDCRQCFALTLWQTGNAGLPTCKYGHVTANAMNSPKSYSCTATAVSCTFRS